MRPRSKSHCANVDDTPIVLYQTAEYPGAAAEVRTQVYIMIGRMRNNQSPKTPCSKAPTCHEESTDTMYSSACTPLRRTATPGGGENTPAWGPSNDGACTDCVGTNYVRMLGSRLVTISGCAVIPGLLSCRARGARQQRRSSERKLVCGASCTQGACR